MKKFANPINMSMLSLCLLMGIAFPSQAAETTKLKTSKTSSHKVSAGEQASTDLATSAVKVQKGGDRFAQQATRILAKTNGLDEQVLELALVAHGNAVRQHQTQKNILTVVDYSMPSSAKRMWVIDLNTEQILFHDYVAHGVNSGGKYTTNFSNDPGSKASSYGVFVTASTYSGEHGYSLKVDGLEKNLNDNARERAIVVHGGNYVSGNVVDMIGRIGRSWGCFTLRPDITKPVIDTIRNKTVIFAYYPNFKWLATSRFLDRRTLS